MKLKLKILFAFVFIFSFFYTSVFSYQEVDIGVFESDIYVEISPENPEPHQDVSVKISSYATDINKAMIEWRSGSKLLASGYGKTSYIFKTLGPNTNIVIDITIIPEGIYQKINKRVIISPTEVDLMWEAVGGYTPPFYKGKSFVSREGKVKVIAIPNINIRLNKANIVYRWKQDDTTILSASGYDKNYYIFENAVINDSENITVFVSSVDGQYNATKNITIPIVSPGIIFYKKSPTEGVLYNKALANDVFFTEDEFTIVAEPYFLAINGNENLFSYAWEVNNEAINTPTKKTELTLRPTSKGGYANISVVLENFNTLFQRVSGKLKINL